MYGSSSKDSSPPATCPAWCHTPRQGQATVLSVPRALMASRTAQSWCSMCTATKLKIRLCCPSLGYHVCLNVTPIIITVFPEVTALSQASVSLSIQREEHPTFSASYCVMWSLCNGCSPGNQLELDSGLTVLCEPLQLT